MIEFNKYRGITISADSTVSAACLTDLGSNLAQEKKNLYGF